MRYHNKENIIIKLSIFNGDMLIKRYFVSIIFLHFSTKAIKMNIDFVPSTY